MLDGHRRASPHALSAYTSDVVTRPVEAHPKSGELLTCLLAMFTVKVFDIPTVTDQEVMSGRYSVNSSMPRSVAATAVKRAFGIGAEPAALLGSPNL
jgi:hypothetical protein